MAHKICRFISLTNLCYSVKSVISVVNYDYISSISVLMVINIIAYGVSV